MDPRFLTGFQQMAEEQMIAGQQRMNPTAGGKLDGEIPIPIRPIVLAAPIKRASSLTKIT